MTAPLAGTTAVVTGGSRGIGASIARALSRSGSRVALIARDVARLESVAATLGSGSVVIPCDLAVEGAAERAAGITRAAFGDPDIVVNNAGALHLGRVGELSLEAFETMVGINLTAPYRLVHAFVPAMRRRGSGHVVTIGSVADHAIFPENAGYSASKFGARAVHGVLRAELRGTGVRVTLVSPGPVDTEAWDPIHPETRPGFPARGDMLRPEDVADAVLWAVTREPTVNVDLVRVERA